MPTLEWIGKDKVVNHHLEVPYRVLEEQYTYNAEASDNMIIRGDNLEALKALLPRYEGKVKCIYIDPPYNTGNEGWVYNDNVNDPRIKKWLGEVVGKEGEDLSRHDKWLCMMYPRLKLLQRLLAEDGVIFISIDDNEQANLKQVCDEIFGARNFVVQIVWQKRTSPDARRKVSTGHEYVLVYLKNVDLSAERFNLLQFSAEDYPDFMVMTKAGMLVLIEFKGDDRDNSDSRMKLELGRQWQAQAGPNYRYFMVFKNKDVGIDGAYRLDQFVGIMREL